MSRDMGRNGRGIAGAKAGGTAAAGATVPAGDGTDDGGPWNAKAHQDPFHSWERRCLRPLEGLREPMGHSKRSIQAAETLRRRERIGIRLHNGLLAQDLAALHSALEGFKALGLRDPAAEALLPELELEPEPELRAPSATVMHHAPAEQHRAALYAFLGRPGGRRTSAWTAPTTSPRRWTRRRGRKASGPAVA